MKKSMTKYSWFTFLLAVFCVFTVVQNMFETKTIGIETFALMGGGTIVSWIPFLCNDIITEVWGQRKAVKAFTLAGLLNFFVVCMAQIVIMLPGTYAEQNVAFEQIFSNGVRTAVASLVAFLFGNFVNTVIMVEMKPKDKGKDNGFLFCARAIVSTVVGQYLDNLLFLVIAFAPIGLSVFEMRWVDILTVTLTGTLLEGLIEAAFVPTVTMPLAKHIKNLNS